METDEVNLHYFYCFCNVSISLNIFQNKMLKKHADFLAFEDFLLQYFTLRASGFDFLTFAPPALPSLGIISCTH